ncbi:hypothetical protein LXA43DRAFT_119499 [Ganoderma leucocontextum]|nr:hypothetical protein LXA43DRAFT_119499 [Ganoderma leucocontextum]
MSQPKLTLRPPPNVDFVQGYPGIPPGGPDRPQAAVKGAIEVRVGQQGVKAKWVRIELRKVETLPGGGVANTFFDFVGQSPINLWQSPNDEYSTLHTNDFPFFIRIPESIPPTIALEKGAGVKYELIASVCVQGKKGFLRRDKPTVTATASTIIIDKHELHSTWPIYSQPETRTHPQDGVTLIVERSHTCYGPGDRVVVIATVKSDTLHTVLLRGFEFMLRETTIFRAAPHTQGKKGSPQVKVSSIGEQKVPVNATLYGGTQHKAELSITVPAHHTSATINAARHIDINYVLTVKALLNTGQPVIMDLPVMISNWPRAVSAEAMRRIGHAFNVSVPGQPNGHQFPAALMGPRTSVSPAPPVSTTSAPTAPSHAHSNSIEQRPSASDIRSPAKPALGQFSTAPSSSDRNYGLSNPNEFGERRKITDSGPTYGAQTIGATNYGSRTRASSSASNDAPSSAARPRSSGGRANPGQRLTITNLNEDEVREHMEAEAERALRHPSTILESPVALEQSVQPPQPQRTPTPKATPTKNWMTAEKEKELLYQRAIENVSRVQGVRSSVDQPSQNGQGDPVSAKGSNTPTPAASKPQKRWLTAEEEKARLFDQAQAAVVRARGQEAFEATGRSASFNGSSSSGAGGSARTAGGSVGVSAGAALYSEAMSAINRPVTSGSPHSQSGSVGSPYAVASPLPFQTPATPGSAHGRLPTSGTMPSAVEEKAMMARYYEAKNAVWQTQSAHYGRVPGNAGPVPYDALYPDQQTTSPAPSHNQLYAGSPAPAPAPSLTSSPPAGMPSPFPAEGSSQHPILSEKERLRRHYEAQDAAAAQPQQQWEPSLPPPEDNYASTPPPGPYPQTPATPPNALYALSPPSGSPPPFSSPQTQLSAFDEKEMLRRKYEQQDATAVGSPRATPTPPPRTSHLVNGSGGRGRPPPTPPSPNPMPGTPGTARPLTAVEEKARLKAMYEAEDRTAAPRPPAPGQSPYPSPPPSNGYHDLAPIPRTTPSPPQLANGAIPPAPPLAPKPPKEYIEETQQEDIRTTAKLQAIDAGKSDPDLASLAPSEADKEPLDVEDADAMNNTFGIVTRSSPGPPPNGGTPGPLRQGSLAAVGSVPPPPPLPPKVLIE